MDRDREWGGYRKFLSYKPRSATLHLDVCGRHHFFSFFYTAIIFRSEETADNLKRQGAYIPGIRPGQQTTNYIDDVITRLTVFGALYVTLVCLLPVFMIVFFDVTFQLGGTALLIVVVVSMDFMGQVQAALSLKPVRKVDGKGKFTQLSGQVSTVALRG